MKPVSGISQHNTAVTLPAGCVTQSAVLELYVVGVILDAVRRNPVVAVIQPGHIGIVEQLSLQSSYSGRYARLVVDRSSDNLHRTFKPTVGDMP